MANHGIRRAAEMEEVADTLARTGGRTAHGDGDRAGVSARWASSARRDAVQGRRRARPRRHAARRSAPLDRRARTHDTDVQITGDMTPQPRRPSAGARAEGRASSRSAAPRRWSIPSASSRGCARRATSSRARTQGADLVIVNTCGFLDSAKAESLDAIGTALAENGKVIVTGCMGAEPESITERYPNVLAVTGPQQYESVLDAVHRAAPPQHDPFLDLVPPRRHQADAAPLRLSEDFRGLQQPLHLLHHPEAARRSRVAPGRRRAARGGEAGRRRRQGTAGHLAGHLGLRRRSQICGEHVEGPRGAREVLRPRRRAGRARRLGAAALRLPLPARRRRHSADGRGQGAALSRHSVPARQPRRCSSACAARPRRRRRWSASRRWREICPDLTIRSTFIVGFPGETEEDFSHSCSTGSTRPSSTASAASATSRCAAPPATISRRRCPTRSRRSAGTASCSASRRSRRGASSARSAPASRSSSTRSARRSPRAAARRDAPEIDGAVYVASRRPLRVGEIATVKIERADDYDLHGTAVGF